MVLFFVFLHLVSEINFLIFSKEDALPKSFKIRLFLSYVKKVHAKLYIAMLCMVVAMEVTWYKSPISTQV